MGKGQAGRSLCGLSGDGPACRRRTGKGGCSRSVKESAGRFPARSLYSNSVPPDGSHTMATPPEHPASEVRHRQREVAAATPSQPWGCDPCRAPRHPQPSERRRPGAPAVARQRGRPDRRTSCRKASNDSSPQDADHHDPAAHQLHARAMACRPTAPQAHRNERGTAGITGRKPRPTTPYGATEPAGASSLSPALVVSESLRSRSELRHLLLEPMRRAGLG